MFGFEVGSTFLSESVDKEIASIKKESKINATNSFLEIKKNLTLGLTTEEKVITHDEIELVEAMNEKVDIFPKLYDWDVWTNIYNVSKNSIDDEVALSTIRLIQLQTYRLEDDSKLTLLVSKDSSSDEKRTRMHTGVTNFDIIKSIGHDVSCGNHATDSRSLVALNLKAESALARQIEDISSKTNATEALMRKNKVSVSKIFQLINGDQRFESLSETASRTLVHENQALAKRTIQLCENIKNDIKVRLLDLRKMKYMKLIGEEANMELYVNEVKDNFERGRISNELNLNSNLQSIKEGLTSMHKVSSIGLSLFRYDGKEVFFHHFFLKLILINCFSLYRDVVLLNQEGGAKARSSRAEILEQADQERAMEQFSLEKTKLLGEERRRTVIFAIETIFNHVLRGIVHVASTNEGRNQIFSLILAATVLVFLVMVAKEFISILFCLLKRFLAMPRLVREWGYGRKRLKLKSENLILSDIVLPLDKEVRLRKFCDCIISGRSRGAPLRNILFYGPNGCGKSFAAKAVAETLQKYQIPFAIMSGSDVSPLGKQGPTELQNVLSWACKRRGILIIDEAESALGKRIKSNQKAITPNNEKPSFAHDALNVFLSMTGNSAGKCMIILTTSNPNSIDEAVLDRCDDCFKMDLPSCEERKRILSKEFRKRFDNSSERIQMEYLPSQQAIKDLARDERTLGFSGRELGMVIRAMEAELYSAHTLSQINWEKMTLDLCQSIKSKRALKHYYKV